MRGRLDSAAVSAAITANVWADRLLGHTEIVSLPVSCGWIATGNNPSLSNELARRTVRIRLDARVDQPWLRTEFRHPDLRFWVQKERSALIWAALVLGQAWLAAGRPRPDVKALGSFESWTTVIGGILSVAEIQGFLSNSDAFYEASDAEGAAWRNFFGSWWARFRAQEVAVKDVFDLAEGLPLGDGGERSQRTRLGKAIAAMRDRQIGDVRLIKATVIDGSQRWKLEEVGKNGT